MRNVLLSHAHCASGRCPNLDSHPLEGMTFDQPHLMGLIPMQHRLHENGLQKGVTSLICLIRGNLLPHHHFIVSLGSVLWFLGCGYCVIYSSSKHYHEHGLHRGKSHMLTETMKIILQSHQTRYTLVQRLFTFYFIFNVKIFYSSQFKVYAFAQ